VLPRRLGKGGKPPFAIPRPVPVRARVGQAITCGHNKVAPSCLSRPKFGSDGREDGREDGTSGVLSYNTLVGGGQALPPNPLPAIRTGGGKIVDGDRAGSDPAEPKREGRTYGICPRANPCATGETPAPPFRHGRAAHRNSLEGKFHECDVPDLLRGRTDSAIARNRAGKAVERRKRFPACSSFPDRQRVSVALGTARGGKFSGRRQRASA